VAKQEANVKIMMVYIHMGSMFPQRTGTRDGWSIFTVPTRLGNALTLRNSLRSYPWIRRFVNEEVSVIHKRSFVHSRFVILVRICVNDAEINLGRCII
jgi:hypothetical protein